MVFYNTVILLIIFIHLNTFAVADSKYRHVGIKLLVIIWKFKRRWKWFYQCFYFVVFCNENKNQPLVEKSHPFAMRAYPVFSTNRFEHNKYIDNVGAYWNLHVLNVVNLMVLTWSNVFWCFCCSIQFSIQTVVDQVLAPVLPLN